MKARAFIAALLLAQPAQQVHSQSGQRQQAPQNQQRGSDSLPVAVKLLNTGKSAEEAAQDDQRADEATKINRRQLYTNVALTLLAALTIGLSYWTFHQTRMTTQQQLRAYLMLEEAIVALAGPGAAVFPLPAAYRVVFKNSGQTPAYDVQMRYRLLIATADESLVPFDAADIFTPSTLPSSSALGPGSAHHISIPSLTNLTLDVRQGLQDGSLNVYVFGRMTYRDTFGRRHVTSFRLRRRRDAHILDVAAGGNDAD